MAKILHYKTFTLFLKDAIIGKHYAMLVSRYPSFAQV